MYYILMFHKQQGNLSDKTTNQGYSALPIILVMFVANEVRFYNYISLTLKGIKLNFSVS